MALGVLWGWLWGLARVTVELGEGEALRVFGPGLVRVEEGLVSILGAELGPGEEVEVLEYRSYVLQALRRSRVVVSVGGGGRVETPAEGEDHYQAWLEVAENVVEECGGPCTVVVVGPVEAGKTSFTAMVSNRALARNVAPAIVDADVGQADIGPPGFVGLGMPENWVAWIRSLDPVDLRFVGSIEPGPVAGRIISAAASLKARALSLGAGVVAVDTDGWVEGWQAVEFKADLVRALEADFVVVVGGEELESYMRRATTASVYSVPAPRVKAERDRGARRELRSNNYARFIGGGEVEVDLRRVAVQGSCVFAGEPLEDPQLRREAEQALQAPVALVTRYPGGTCFVLETRDPPDPQRVRQLQRRLGGDVLVVYTGGFRGVLAALTDPQGFDHPAMLLEADPHGGTAVFRTRYQGPVERVAFGRVRLNPDTYTEEARGRIWI